MLTAEEIAEERCVVHLGIRVKSVEGYLDVTHVCKTVPLPVWELKTTKRSLVCAGKHLVVLGDDSGEFCPVERLAPGNTVISEDGIEMVESVTDLHEERELYDLRVEGPDHIYFTNGILSHNSTGIGGSLLYKLNMLDHCRALYIAPLKDQVKTFADRLQDMQRGSVFSPEAIVSKGLRNNLYYKESPRGGSLRLQNLLTDPSRVRGQSVDDIVIDECKLWSTEIRTEAGLEKIVDLVRGARIISFDEHNNTVIDTVVRTVCKGLRPTWRVVTASGCQLTCTGNERLRSTEGWRYLASLLSTSEAAVCPRTKRAKAVGDSQNNGAGDSLGRRVSVSQGYASALPMRTRTSTEGLLCPERTTDSEFCENPSEGSGEQGIRGSLSSVQHPDLPRVRLPDSALLPSSPGDRQTQEDRDPGVGLDPDLGDDCMVVHGRRLQAGTRPSHSDPLVLEGGGGHPGQPPDRNGLPGARAQDQEGQGQDILHPEDPDRVRPGIRGERPTVHPPDDALQVGGDRPLWDGVELYVLRKRVCGERATQGRTGEDPVLSAPHLQEEGRSAAGQGLREKSRRTAGALSEGEGCQSEAAAGGTGTPATAYQRASERAARRDVTGGEGEVSTEEEGSTGGLEVGEEWEMIPSAIVSIEYAGEQEVWDVETENHHTLFAGGIAVHNCQDFDMDHLPELAQVQKASKRPSRVFAGTSKELDTCLEIHYQQGSRGVWHVRGGKPGLWWSLNDPDVIDKIITVEGLRCPVTGKLMNPMDGEFIHEDMRRVYAGFPSFHLPQIIVPEYTSGVKWLEIWHDFQHYPRPKFLKEVMGIPVEAGNREITEDDLKRMCDPDMTFGKIQAELASGKRRYHYIISGCDWGGSDYNPATKTKQSYTVHVMLGITHDGNFDLIHAQRYAGMAYQDIAGHIVHNHNKFGGFAIACDNGVGQYYNAYLRDCGKIRSDRLILFQCNDVKDYMAPIENSMFNLYSLNRTDSISALFADVKPPRMRLRCPRWDESSPYLMDFLNSFRSVTETPNGRGIMRYIRHGSKADDFMQACNFAFNLGRVLLRENMIPSQQLLDEMAHMMQTGSAGHGGGSLFQGGWGDYFSG